MHKDKKIKIKTKTKKEKEKRKEKRKRKKKKKKKKKKKEFVKTVTKKRKRKSINMIAKEKIVKIERNVIDQERSIQMKEVLICKKIVMREVEARIIIKKIKIVSIRKRKSVEIALKIEKRIIAAHEKEKKEAIIDLFIIKTLFILIFSSIELFLYFT